MGYPEKPQMDGALVDSVDGKRWVVAGIAFRRPLKPIFTTNSVEKVQKDDGVGEDDECVTTPTAEEARIPAMLPCPPPPRKRKPSRRCSYNGGAREFFTPPDLETVFIRRTC
ncbi:cyclin-dependent protein kinase inhibitor SMR8 [Diospyros lotus]|uniref:cyclin-dependent protein kinase inhibitor SMR8 n=1 Tax=Diospyros lotus TaxID=55363 RepID=UPI00224F0F56|nr:cyclin-dependent protein kinase inhibitor SMR8 [Diospyros lotus]